MRTELPDPALVVLVGASGAGKSSWATARYRTPEIVSADELRGVVGSGRHDLDASTEAFTLLDQIVAARLRRGLACVIDTLGLDAARRAGYVALARAHAMPAVAVLLDTPPALIRVRNARRERPVPAPVLARQLARVVQVREELADEGWDDVVVSPGADDRGDLGADARGQSAPTALPPATSDAVETQFVLQLSRFPWGTDPAAWLRDMARAAEAAGFAGLALMDHLIQIPQVDRAWAPIPEPWVTLGLLAGLDTKLRLGTLVTPATFRPAGITAKAVATLDALSGGRAFLGVGAGWWAREHAAFGLPFPSVPQRMDLLEDAIVTIRALLAPGTKAYRDGRVELPETTCYPRPVGALPIIVGGGGERRTLEIAARLADGVNLPSDEALLAHKIDVLHRHCERVGRDRAEVAVTVLDVPVVGRDRDEVWSRVERLRGRTTAATFARTHHAGTYAEQRDRYARLAESGVRTVFVAPMHLTGADDVLALAPMLH